MACRILLADESLNTQRLWAQYLAELGYDVTAVGSGPAAVEHLRAHPTDLIIADSGLRELSGRELCSLLEQNSAWSHIPVLLTLRAFDQGTEEELRAAGAAAVLRKPFSPAMLEKYVADLTPPGQLPSPPAPGAADAPEPQAPETHAMELEPEPDQPAAVEAETVETQPESHTAPIQPEDSSVPEAPPAITDAEPQAEAAEAVSSPEPEAEKLAQSDVPNNMLAAAQSQPKPADPVPAAQPESDKIGQSDVPDNLLAAVLLEAALTASVPFPAQPGAGQAPPVQLRQILRQYLSPALAEEAAARIEDRLPLARP